MKMSKITIPHIPFIVQNGIRIKKQSCGFCPGDMCLLDCNLCSKDKKIDFRFYISQIFETSYVPAFFQI